MTFNFYSFARTILAALTSALLLAMTVHAGGNHGKPLHGGIVAESSAFEAELVVKQTLATIYLNDHGKDLSSKGVTGKLTVLAEGKTYTATPGELLVERMVKELKRPGRAGGGGFYDYPAGAKKHLWPDLKPLFEKPGVEWSVQEIQDRLLYRQAIETARCLAEGVLTSVHDANIGSIFGIGFPAWTGGAMQFIYGTGNEAFVRRANQLAAKYGAGFEVDATARETIAGLRPLY